MKARRCPRLGSFLSLGRIARLKLVGAKEWFKPFLGGRELSEDQQSMENWTDVSLTEQSVLNTGIKPQHALFHSGLANCHRERLGQSWDSLRSFCSR